MAAFGFHAGYAGAALALLDWAWQLEHGNKEALPSKGHYQRKRDLDIELKEHVSKGVQKNQGNPPRVLVIGALGRCGRGALECCRQAGVPEGHIMKWDMDETAQPGPYNAIKEADVFINCIYLSEPLPPFISTDFLNQGTRNLSVICDVSCDTTNPHNPIPFANQSTYFSKPTIILPDFSDPPLSYISIDHLPSLLPREASEAFSEALLPSLLQLPERATAPVWVGAEKMFREKVALLPQALRQKETPVADGDGKA